jgi:putative glutamine amidotransferase
MAWPLQTPPDGPSGRNDPKPRIGLPFCSAKEERTGDLEAHARYVRAIALAGGEPVPISLQLHETELRGLLERMGGFVLPGSGADVNPELFHVKRHAKSAEADQARERIDFALLRHAIDTRKPVLAICYGIEPESRMARLSRCAEITVNSSHHQSVREPGLGLRIVARASDGVVEAVEYLESGGWIIGVQWHPERLIEDTLSMGLFRETVAAAKAAFAGYIEK